MAYIVAQDVVVEISQSTVDVSIPIPHAANDLILMFISQDGGGTNITTAASGWNLVGSQAAAQAQRNVVYWRLATSSSEADVQFSGSTAPWIVFTTIIRGADQTTPINASDRTDSANSTSNNLTSGTVTTTVANCVVFSFIHIDGLFKITPENPNQVTSVFKQLGGNTCALLNIFNQLTAGTTSTVNYLLETASEGGSVWTVAIADASPSTAGLSPTAPRCYDIVKRYGGISTYGAADPAFTRHDGITWQTLSNIAATSIDSVTVLNNAFTEVNQQSVGQPWGSMTGISVAESAIDSTGRWVGATHAITSTDFSDKIIHIEWQQSAISTAFYGVKGVIIYLEDSSNNWVAHILSIRQGVVANTSYVTHIDTNYTPYASGGSVDLTDITRVAYMYHRYTTTATASILRVQNLLIFDSVEVVGGCSGDPITTGKFQNFYTGHGPLYDATVQGNGQALIREGVMIGDGSQASYADLSTNSLETPLSFGSTITRRFWKVNTESTSCQFKLKASANDTINYTACVIGTATRQIFQVDAASSASATYNFAGSSIVNWLVKNDVFNFNDCTFVRCAFILNGGGVDGCELTDCEPLVTDDTSNISSSNFTSPGTGHAITITATGTFSLEGNTFSGYGANATTDAAIYNNSGGAVTLNLLATDTTPTIRNGTGASTTLAFAAVNVTATILANSRVQLYNVTTATEIDNVFVAGTSYSYGITTEATVGDTVRLRVCKKGYEPFEANAVFALTGVPLVINQEVDAIYTAYALDGATITIFDADYIDDEIDLNVASNFGADEFYAWYNNNLTTEDGIRSFYGGVTAVAETDILINTAIVDLKFDNLTTSNVFQQDSIRIHRDDEAYPVKNPTTGGGGIDLVWRNQAYLPSITALAPFAVLVAAGVWERPTASHVTAGTFGVELGTNITEHNATQSAIASTATQASVDVIDANVDAIKAKTDNLPSDPADESSIQAAIAAIPSAPSAADIADAVWDENIVGHQTAGTMGRLLTLSGAIIDETTATGTPSTSSIQLAVGSTVDDFYNDQLLVIVSGAGLGQVRIIVDYVGATKTCTFDEPFAVAPAFGDALVVKADHVHPVSQFADAVWDEATSGHVTAGSFGLEVGTNLTEHNATQTAVADTAKTTELDVVNQGVKKASLLVPHTDDI